MRLSCISGCFRRDGGTKGGISASTDPGDYAHKPDPPIENSPPNTSEVTEKCSAKDPAAWDNGTINISITGLKIPANYVPGDTPPTPTLFPRNSGQVCKVSANPLQIPEDFGLAAPVHSLTSWQCFLEQSPTATAKQAEVSTSSKTLSPALSMISSVNSGVMESCAMLDDSLLVGIAPASNGPAQHLLDNAQQHPTQEPVEEEPEGLDPCMVDMAKLAFDEVKLGSVIGLGSYGKVHVGWARGVKVAVKVIAHPMTASLEEMDAAEKEAVLSEQLQHPNLVQTFAIYRIAVSGQGQFHTHMRASTMELQTHLVMEYCNQGTLRAALDDNIFICPFKKRPNQVQLAQVAIDIAEALLYMHSNDLVHRDLKSANIMLHRKSNDPEEPLIVKVADFGLSKIVPSDGIVMNSRIGTLTHTAPEVLLGHAANKSADVYAFGVILWELYTCKHPYHNMRPFDVILSKQKIPMAAALPLPSHCPQAYRDLCCDCWADANGRPSMEEVVERLLQLLPECSAAAARRSVDHTIRCSSEGGLGLGDRRSGSNSSKISLNLIGMMKPSPRSSMSSQTSPLSPSTPIGALEDFLSFSRAAVTASRLSQSSIPGRTDSSFPSRGPSSDLPEYRESMSSPVSYEYLRQFSRGRSFNSTRSSLDIPVNEGPGGKVAPVVRNQASGSGLPRPTSLNSMDSTWEATRGLCSSRAGSAKQLLNNPYGQSEAGGRPELIGMGSGDSAKATFEIWQEQREYHRSQSRIGRKASLGECNGAGSIEQASGSAGKGSTVIASGSAGSAGSSLERGSGTGEEGDTVDIEAGGMLIAWGGQQADPSGVLDGHNMGSCVGTIEDGSGQAVQVVGKGHVTGCIESCCGDEAGCMQSAPAELHDSVMLVTFGMPAGGQPGVKGKSSVRRTDSSIFVNGRTMSSSCSSIENNGGHRCSGASNECGRNADNTGGGYNSDVSPAVGSSSGNNSSSVDMGRNGSNGDSSTDISSSGCGSGNSDGRTGSGTGLGFSAAGSSARDVHSSSIGNSNIGGSKGVSSNSSSNSSSNNMSSSNSNSVSGKNMSRAKPEGALRRAPVRQPSKLKRATGPSSPPPFADSNVTWGPTVTSRSHRHSDGTHQVAGWIEPHRLQPSKSNSAGDLSDRLALAMTGVEKQQVQEAERQQQDGSGQLEGGTQLSNKWVGKKGASSQNVDHVTKQQQGEHGATLHDKHAVQQDDGMQQQDGTSKQQDSTSTQQAGTSEQQDSTPEQQAGTPKQQDSTSKQQDSTSKQQDSTSKQQDSTSKQQDSMSKQQDSTSKQQDNNVTKQQEVAASQPRIAANSEVVANTRQAAPVTDGVGQPTSMPPDNLHSGKIPTDSAGLAAAAIVSSGSAESYLHASGTSPKKHEEVTAPCTLATHSDGAHTSTDPCPGSSRRSSLQDIQILTGHNFHEMAAANSQMPRRRNSSSISNLPAVDIQPRRTSSSSSMIVVSQAQYLRVNGQDKVFSVAPAIQGQPDQVNAGHRYLPSQPSYPNSGRRASFVNEFVRCTQTRTPTASTSQAGRAGRHQNHRASTGNIDFAALAPGHRMRDKLSSVSVAKAPGHAGTVQPVPGQGLRDSSVSSPSTPPAQVVVLSSQSIQARRTAPISRSASMAQRRQRSEANMVSIPSGVVMQHPRHTAEKTQVPKCSVELPDAVLHSLKTSARAIAVGASNGYSDHPASLTAATDCNTSEEAATVNVVSITGTATSAAASYTTPATTPTTASVSISATVSAGTSATPVTCKSITKEAETCAAVTSAAHTGAICPPTTTGTRDAHTATNSASTTQELGSSAAPIAPQPPTSQRPTSVASTYQNQPHFHAVYNNPTHQFEHPTPVPQNPSLSSAKAFARAIFLTGPLTGFTGQLSASKIRSIPRAKSIDPVSQPKLMQRTPPRQSFDVQLLQQTRMVVRSPGNAASHLNALISDGYRSSKQRTSENKKAMDDSVQQSRWACQVNQGNATPHVAKDCALVAIEVASGRQNLPFSDVSFESAAMDKAGSEVPNAVEFHFKAGADEESTSDKHLRTKEATGALGCENRSLSTGITSVSLAENGPEMALDVHGVFGGSKPVTLAATGNPSELEPKIHDTTTGVQGSMQLSTQVRAGANDEHSIHSVAAHNGHGLMNPGTSSKATSPKTRVALSAKLSIDTSFSFFKSKNQGSACALTPVTPELGTAVNMFGKDS